MQKEYVDKTFLGKGWSFPPEFHSGTYSNKLSSEDEDIKESLFILLSTIPGERVMRPEYGCDLHGLIFHPKSPETEREITSLISMAILRYEARITVDDIRVNMDYFENNGLVLVHLDYTVIEVNTRSNIVYPYYLQEGTLVGEV